MSNKQREALLMVKKLFDGKIMFQQDIREAHKAVNAALAEQNEAKWELGAEYEFAYCSHCGHLQWAGWDSHREAAENIGEFHKEYNFCPICGFEMKE